MSSPAHKKQDHKKCMPGLNGLSKTLESTIFDEIDEWI